MSSQKGASVAPPLARFAYRAPAIRRSPGLFALAAAGLAAVLITHLIAFGAHRLDIRLLNANSGTSWSHLLTAALLLAATAAGVVGAWRSQGRRFLWAATAGILGFISIDEISSLHVQIDRMSWGKLVYAPILVILCMCLWRLSDGNRSGAAVRAGLATLLISFGIHVFGPHVVHALGWGDNSWAYQVKVALKQGTELAGWLLVMGGLWRLVAETSRRT